MELGRAGGPLPHQQGNPGGGAGARERPGNQGMGGHGAGDRGARRALVGVFWGGGGQYPCDPTLGQFWGPGLQDAGMGQA